MAAQLLATPTINPNTNPIASVPVAPAPKEVPTFDTFTRECWIPRGAHKAKLATQRQKAKLARVLSKHFGPRRLDEIDVRAIDEWIPTLQGRYKPTTQGVLAVALRSNLLLAHEYGLIGRPPKIDIKARSHNGEDLFWTSEQAERVVAAAQPPFAAMIDVAARTGLRIGELRALRWCNVDLDARTIRVCENYVLGKVGTPKGNRPRESPLSDGCHATLADLRARSNGSPFVFSGPDGARLGRDAVYRELRRAAEAAGCPLPKGKAWHVLRHSFGTIMSGGAGGSSVPMPIVRDLMGHADMRETDRYVHTDRLSLARAVTRIDQGRSAPTEPRTTAPTAPPTLP